MPTLLLRPPPTSLALGVVTHIADEREHIDYATAQTQWKAYGDVFRRQGWNVVEVGQDDTLPDSVFVEDGVISVPRLVTDESDDSTAKRENGLLILASPGNAARQDEPVGIEETIKQKLGHLASTVRQIQRPGTLDGGDVLKVPAFRTIYVGESGRTNEEGIRQLQALCEPLGWQIRRVPVVKALHLKSMLTALPDGTIIGYEPLLEDVSVFDRWESMPEPAGVAVVHLDSAIVNAQTPLLMSSSAPLSAQKLKALGYNIITTDIGEFEKLEGCVTCLSVRIRHD